MTKDKTKGENKNRPPVFKSKLSYEKTNTL